MLSAYCRALARLDVTSTVHLKPVDARPKVLLVSNTSWYLYNFRRHLGKALQDKGFNVLFVSPRDKYTDLLQSEGFGYFDWDLDRKSINPRLRSFYQFTG